LDETPLRLDFGFLKADVFRARFAAHSNQDFFRFDLLLLAVNADGYGNAGFRLVNLLNLRAVWKLIPTLAVDAGNSLKFFVFHGNKAAATSRQS